MQSVCADVGREGGGYGENGWRGLCNDCVLVVWVRNVVIGGGGMGRMEDGTECYQSAIKELLGSC